MLALLTFADSRSLTDIHKAYFGAGIDVLCLKYVKLQLEIQLLAKQISGHSTVPITTPGKFLQSLCKISVCVMSSHVLAGLIAVISIGFYALFI